MENTDLIYNNNNFSPAVPPQVQHADFATHQLNDYITHIKNKGVYIIKRKQHGLFFYCSNLFPRRLHSSY